MHLACGKYKDISPKEFIYSNGKCENCYTKISSMNNKNIIESKIDKLEFKILKGFTNKATKLKLKHLKCNSEFEVTFDQIDKGNISCYNCNQMKKQAEFKSKVVDLHGDDYEVLSNYTQLYKHIKVKHNKCGVIYDTLAINILEDKSCSYCNGMKKTTDIFSKEVSALTCGEYEVTGEYINAESIIQMRHIKCGNIYNVRPSKFIEGSRCPNCRESQGERAISNWLQYNGFNYEHEFTFEDCVYINKLRFDFAVFNNDNTLSCLIEYDGEQYFKPVGLFGSEEGFKETRLRDQIKDEYCKKNNIKLIRIPYWEFKQINMILKIELSRSLENVSI